MTYLSADSESAYLDLFLRQQPTDALSTEADSALVIGEALIDEVSLNPPPAPPERIPGGSPANVALGLRRLGIPVALCTHLSAQTADADRQRIASYLTAAGVKLTPGSFTAPFTSVAQVSLNEQGEPQYNFVLDWDPELPRLQPLPAAVHVGSLGTYLTPGASAVVEFSRKASYHTLLTYDPNFRPAIMERGLLLNARVAELLAHAHLVKVSEEDLRWYRPEADPLELAQNWATRGPALVVLTRGGEGVTAFWQNGQRSAQLSGLSVPVADTVGAGDSFMAALVAGCLSLGFSGENSSKLAEALSDQLVGALLSFGVYASALTVQQHGAQLPTAANVRELRGSLPTLCPQYLPGEEIVPPPTPPLPF